MHKAFWKILAILQTGILSLSVIAQTPTPTPKPGITEKDLEKYTHYFDVTANGLIGDGVKFLTDESRRNQYFILGEYHGSKRISEFTRAMIPILHESGYRHFGLEIGPVSVEILRELSKDPTTAIQNLRAFNSKFLERRGERDFTPIPFFSNVEDAEFLVEATKRKWSLIGLDQEFSFSYFPLLERMHEALSRKRRAELGPKYDAARKDLEAIYRDDASRTRNPYIAISESAAINLYINEASTGNPKNAVIADAIRTTTDIYKNNASTIRKYYLANGTRVDYMKKNLTAGFSSNRFDLKRDKMLLKMGAVHTGRGFSPLSLFEIGNTLSEQAAFNGNSSVHINFGSRFYMDGGKEVDALADPAAFDYRFKALLQMGRRDQWTVIDLRPLREAVFYHRRFEIDEVVREIWKNHDLFIIPKLDTDPTPNFTKKP